MRYLVKNRASGQLQAVESLNGHTAGYDLLGEIPAGIKNPTVIAGKIVEHIAPSWAHFRGHRGALLLITDSTQAPDRPDAYRADWAAYRASLRNLPAGLTDPHAVAWPTPPDAAELRRLADAFHAAVTISAPGFMEALSMSGA